MWAIDSPHKITAVRWKFFSDTNMGTMQFAPNTRFQLKHFYFAFLCFEYYCLCIFTVGKINFIPFFSMNIFTLPTTEQTRSYFVALNYVPLWYSGEAVGLCTTMEPGSKPSSGKKFLLKKFFLIESKAGQRVDIPRRSRVLSAYCDLRAPGAAGEFQPIVTLGCRSKGGHPPAQPGRVILLLLYFVTTF
jgi:hypothetical protein